MPTIRRSFITEGGLFKQGYNAELDELLDLVEHGENRVKALLDEGDLLSVDAKMDCFQDLENKSNPLYENDRRKLNSTVNIRACANGLRLFEKI